MEYPSDNIIIFITSSPAIESETAHLAESVPRSSFILGLASTDLAYMDQRVAIDISWVSPDLPALTVWCDAVAKSEVCLFRVLI